MRFSALGDVAMTVPVVYSACRLNSDVRFVMVTKKQTSGLFVNAPENLVVYGADVKGRHSGPAGLWRLFGDLRREFSPSAFIDLHDVTRTRIIRGMARLTGMRVSVFDKGRAEKKRLVRHRGHVPLRQLPTSYERYAGAFKALGYKVDPDKFTSLFAPGDQLMPLGDISPEKEPGEIWIGIAPFAAHRGKVYPPDKMERVIALLSAMPRSRIFMFGAGDEEREAIERWCEKFPGIVSMARRRHGFAAEFNLLRRIDVMVTMDSANMHIASLAGVPVASIWGQTHPCCGFYGWRQQRADAVEIVGMECRPCSVFGNRECRRQHPYECMDIAPETVVAKVNQILSRKK